MDFKVTTPHRRNYCDGQPHVDHNVQPSCQRSPQKSATGDDEKLELLVCGFRDIADADCSPRVWLDLEALDSTFVLLEAVLLHVCVVDLGLRHVLRVAAGINDRGLLGVPVRRKGINFAI